MTASPSKSIRKNDHLGTIYTYIAYKTQFIQKASSLVDQGVAFLILGLHLERLSDIALYPEDKSFQQTSEMGGDLAGRIEFKNVSYRYSNADPFVLQDANLVIEPGEHVAITGPSGGGKTTLIKLLLGLIEPEHGEILIDGLPLSRFGYRSFRGQVAAVLQDDTLFAGSLAQNIALFDDEMDMARVAQAAIAASIHDDITAMPMQYETLVGEMGSTLSGGQKQRVLLARALYRNPKVLVMDEGTSHLDVVHERAVNAAIAPMGITLVLVAHRKETIEAAKRVVIVAGGKLHRAEDLRSVKDS